MRNSFQPVSRTTLGEQVAIQIIEMIAAGHLKPGQKLPSESQLCESYQVGRSTVREALRALAFIGIVNMRHGEGSFVGERPSIFLDRVFYRGLLNTEREVCELADARTVIESELAALSARFAAEEDLSRLAGLIDQMQSFVDSGIGDFLQLDMDFHFAIAQASQNNVLYQLLRTLRNLLTEYIFRSLQVPASAVIGLAAHRKIFEAISNRNPDQARAAMRTHLQTFAQTYSLLNKVADRNHRQDSCTSAASEAIERITDAVLIDD